MHLSNKTECCLFIAMPLLHRWIDKEYRLKLVVNVLAWNRNVAWFTVSFRFDKRLRNNKLTVHHATLRSHANTFFLLDTITYAISIDIEPRLLRRPYSHITSKPNVYFPPCKTPIPTPFDFLCAYVFHVRLNIITFLIPVDTITKKRLLNAMTNSTVLFKVTSVVFIGIGCMSCHLFVFVVFWYHISLKTIWHVTPSSYTTDTINLRKTTLPCQS